MIAVLPLGNRIARRLSHRTFDYAVLAVLLAAAGTMTYDALVTP